jgi:sec-independent protein translocase protein TatB
MLDFGFSEILLTSAIALVVLGPEKLPKVARQVGNWMGRARLMARQLSEQLEREVNAEELLKQQTRIPPAAPARVPPGALAPALSPASDAHTGPVPAEGLSQAAVELASNSEVVAAPAVEPGAVVAQPVSRRTPHPNSPEMMHRNSPAATPTATPTPTTTTTTPQQSSQ